MNSHSNFLDKEQAEIRAWQRKFRGAVSDALKSHAQMVAEELLEIQAERVAKEAEIETLERLARASQQGREKAANEFSASNRHAAAPESPPAIDIGERERKSRTNTPPFHTVALHQLVERQRRIQLAGLEERERIRVREEHEASKAKAQDAAPVVAERASVTHTTKARRDALTPVVELAQSRCINPKDTAEVWARLLVLAEQKHPPLLGATEDGLQYLKDGAAAHFTRDALSKRLIRKPPISAGGRR